MRIRQISTVDPAVTEGPRSSIRPCRCIGRLINDIANLPVGYQQCANGFRVSDCVDLSFIQRQSKLPRWKYTPGDVPAPIYMINWK
jgi:hypothetical protein